MIGSFTISGASNKNLVTNLLSVSQCRLIVGGDNASTRCEVLGEILE
jgi:hypothetical protein